jgi:hypothetical protein
MSWSINIPHRDPAAPVTEIAACARALPEAERAVVRQLALDLLLDGVGTVGDALDIVQSADQAARRALLDRARRRAGLPTTAEVDAHKRVEAASRSALPHRAATTGRPVRLAYSASGAIVDLDEGEAEAARARVEERSRRAQREAREAERRAEAAELAEHERAWRDRLRRELPPGMPG